MTLKVYQCLSADISAASEFSITDEMLESPIYAGKTMDIFGGIKFLEENVPYATTSVAPVLTEIRRYIVVTKRIRPRKDLSCTLLNEITSFAAVVLSASLIHQDQQRV